ncbi:isochorismatase family protein [Tuwongella immobilis]|uniref:Isochorismatase-like domain-containing protein n=1 Tax=Tuwongella immobilis TaxID=692036 RepID=A0A6C2YPD3_9BACT|nr:isochorismatase family protein [Tuwongella immobilis]VIP02895.1 isochorismatase : Isochorismatase OS=Caenispirillum salinarum AK4 GN=C882_2741 PE=4 SV=1: Isochorismatase [Tuwongella immobilis]VTS02773.1 isochorismatase : Isochorismatase OS=Caenispirillum salinarum AK4 GN=C882_2741 PE=4 SV=1: Isochorismatase [Tuwongella immobilis]
MTNFSADNSRLVIVDVQEKLVPHIHHGGEVVQTLGMLLAVAKMLEIPTTITEQYPKGLGPTASQLAIDPALTVFEKTRFSAVHGVPSDCNWVILTGFETHICIWLTAIELIQKGFTVAVVVDAVGARRTLDHDMALRRLEQAGAMLTTAETVVFTWLADAEHDRFRAISQLVQARAKGMG